jgi:hypothetical protein
MKGLYPQASGEIAIIFLQDGDDFDAVCKRITPYNTPYLIVDDSDLPEDWSTSAAWECDFSSPSGIGMGPQRYFIAQAAAVIENPESTPEQIEAAMLLSEQMQREIIELEGAPM